MFRAIQRLRVEWAQCDPARIIFNPTYYIWMDQGTHSLFEAAGFDFVEETAGSGFRGLPLVTSGAEFFTPARLGDRLVMTSHVEKFGTKSFTVLHEFHRGEELLARGREVRVWTGAAPEDDPERLVAAPVPEPVKALMARDEEVDMSA